VNGLSDPDETYREYSLAFIDDLIRFWKSRSRAQQATIHIDAGASKSIKFN